jgi:hypothetical protein
MCEADGVNARHSNIQPRVYAVRLALARGCAAPPDVGQRRSTLVDIRISIRAIRVIRG